MKLLFVDPGKRCLGWARFSEEGLLECDLATTQLDDLGHGAQDMARQLPWSMDRVIAELPRIYPHDRRIRLNDLVDLAAVAGVCAMAGPLEFVHPASWKGQTPKDICHLRARRELSLPELAVLDKSLARIAERLQHNVLDAVGIGLNICKREGLRG